MAALQMSTALNLLTAGANMLLMYSGALGTVPTGVQPVGAQATAVAGPEAVAAPVEPVTRLSRIEKAISSASVVMPASLGVPAERSMAVREVVLGGTGTRTSAVTSEEHRLCPPGTSKASTGHRR